MALPFINSKSKASDQLLAIDLGCRTTKAVVLQRKGEGFLLSRYALLDAPIYEKSLSVDLLSDHLKNLTQALDIKVKRAAIAVGVSDSVVRHAEIPLMPVEDMRQILKNNTKTYLQQDLPGYVFDCHIVVARQPAMAPEKLKGAGNVPKTKVLAAGAKKQFIDDLQAAIRNAGLVAQHIVPGLVGPINAFEMTMPEPFSKGILALVDIGFKNTTISLLQQGELILSRAVSIGGDRLSSGLAESMGISYAEAEGIKVGMPSEVQANLEALLIPLGRELRASIDFFEHQQDKTVTEVFISGGSARSEFIVQVLQSELMIECKPWSPLNFLEMALPPQQTAEIEMVAPQLTVAVGAALAAL